MADTQGQGVGQTVDGLINKATGWVDTVFEFFGVYTAKYSKYLVYALLLVAAAKLIKIRLNIGGGRR